MTIGYLVDGELVIGLQALATKLGKPVSNSDILNHRIEGLEVVSVIRGSIEPDDVPEDKKHKVIYTALEDEDFLTLPHTSKQELLSTVPHFSNLGEFKQFVADLDTRSLEYLAQGLGLTWKHTYHRHIHRMRISMALRKLLVDTDKPKGSEKRDKYSDMTNDELLAIAIKYGLDPTPINTPIDRIRLTSNLIRRNFA